MLGQVVASSSSHLIHTHCILIGVSVFTLLLGTEGRPLCLRRHFSCCITCVQEVAHVAVCGGALCDAAKDG